MGGSKLLSSRFVLCFMFVIVSLVILRSTCSIQMGWSVRLDPRVLSWCNIRELSSLYLPSARCEWALCVGVIREWNSLLWSCLGSSMWRVVFANAFIHVHMCSLLCMFGTQSYLPSHRTGRCKFKNSLASLCRLTDQAEKQQPAYQIAACVGGFNQRQCSFSIGYLQCCTWILVRTSI